MGHRILRPIEEQPTPHLHVTSIFVE